MKRINWRSVAWKAETIFGLVGLYAGGFAVIALLSALVAP